MDAGNIWEIQNNNSKYVQANFSINTFIDQIAINVGYGLRYDFQYFILRTDIGFPVREPWQSSKMQWEKLNHKQAQLNIGLSYPF
jgi:outer membrane protein assembly factor BamA